MGTFEGQSYQIGGKYSHFIYKTDVDFSEAGVCSTWTIEEDLIDYTDANQIEIAAVFYFCKEPREKTSEFIIPNSSTMNESASHASSLLGFISCPYVRAPPGFAPSCSNGSNFLALHVLLGAEF